MALFSRKKDSKTAVKTPTKVTNTSAVKEDFSRLIVRPRLTEKAVKQSENNVYTFEVNKDANKFLVAAAVKALYNVTPVKVNIVNKRPATRLKGSQNRMVKVPGSRKAYVYLKKGETINLI